MSIWIDIVHPPGRTAALGANRGAAMLLPRTSQSALVEQPRQEMGLVQANWAAQEQGINYGGQWSEEKAQPPFAERGIQCRKPKSMQT
jgi:hypothetical protein